MRISNSKTRIDAVPMSTTAMRFQMFMSVVTYARPIPIATLLFEDLEDPKLCLSQKPLCQP